MSAKPVIVGSRGSGLALTQTRAIVRELAAANPDFAFEIKIIKTTGDHLSEINAPDMPPGKGIFTAEIEYALLRKEIDLAVHSLKDLPVDMRADLSISSIPHRADSRDLLVTCNPVHSLDDLPEGAVIATGSPRRAAQLRHYRADLQTAEIRGNIDTRLRKLRENPAWSGILLAKAGVDRLKPDVSGLVLTPLSLKIILPAPGQGALALQIRAGDELHQSIVGKVHDSSTAACVQAERAFLAGLGGGCQAPVAAIAEIDGDSLNLTGVCWINNEPQPRRGQMHDLHMNAEKLGRALAGKLSSNL